MLILEVLIYSKKQISSSTENCDSIGKISACSLSVKILGTPVTKETKKYVPMGINYPRTAELICILKEDFQCKNKLYSNNTSPYKDRMEVSI
jgi:hypothetical protein